MNRRQKKLRELVETERCQQRLSFSDRLRRRFLGALCLPAAFHQKRLSGPLFFFLVHGSTPREDNQSPSSAGAETTRITRILKTCGLEASDRLRLPCARAKGTQPA